MKKVNSTIGKIILMTVCAGFILPFWKFQISCIGALAILSITAYQHFIGPAYPYSITECICTATQGDTEALRNELQEFANNCPYFDEATCLTRNFCPDCPYGKEY